MAQTLRFIHGGSANRLGCGYRMAKGAGMSSYSRWNTPPPRCHGKPSRGTQMRGSREAGLIARAMRAQRTQVQEVLR